jgi:IS6 family transposase
LAGWSIPPFHYPSTQPDHAGRLSGNAGSLMRPTSKSPESADTFTNLAAPVLRVVDELFPEALLDTGRRADNRIKIGHGRLKTRLKTTRGLRLVRTASNVIRCRAFVQNLRRGHYEFGVDANPERLGRSAAFGELAEAI